MVFDSFYAFVYMNGHGIYVWPAFILAISLMIFMLLKPSFSRKKFLAELRQKILREETQLAKNRN